MVIYLCAQGINLPGTKCDLPAITEKDKEDLMFGVRQGVDLIAASFVRKVGRNETPK
jgi:pyruvate kinase